MCLRRPLSWSERGRTPELGLTEREGRGRYGRPRTERGEHPLLRGCCALQGYWKTSSRRARGAGASVEVILTVDDLPKEGMEGGEKETESMILGAGSAPGWTAASTADLASDERLLTRVASDEVMTAAVKARRGPSDSVSVMRWRSNRERE